MKNFLRIVLHPFKFRFYLLTKLPAAFFSGVKVRYADESKCIATVPYKWFSQNPFGSTYFACLSMAAEMSTGILAMTHCYDQKPGISMLVVKTEGVFFKKAKGITSFTCEDGSLIEMTIKEAMSSGKGQTTACRSVGTDDSGDIIAEFTITWSFRVKTQ